MSGEESSTPGSSPSGSSGEKGTGGPSYALKSTGTNSKGNHWCSRDYSTSQPGAPNRNTYHYSNKDGSYYYLNPDGSTYYNDGKGGSRYTKK